MRVSVVVPIYNVETYLAACLESLAAQTLTDIEVVMVNDGSTDGSPAIAEAFAARDPRFKLISQPNGGLSRARNTGIDAATGEFLAFVDSDDVVAPNAYELLVAALDRSGSDFASGFAHRLTSSGTRPVVFLAKAFAETRLKTHITRDRLLLRDRTAWNKLFRRSFWDEQGRRFPDGRLYEDIPVTLPLHFAARSVDVLSDVIYYWRTREGEDLSITQRRADPRALDDRLAAIRDVDEYLAQTGRRRERRWYDASVVADDLKLFLNVIDDGDEEYRAHFLERVNGFLAGVGRGAYRRLAAVDRIKWFLVRRRMLPELLELRRWQREEMRETPPVRVRGHWYLDHPLRKRLPRRLFRVDRELDFSTGLERLDWEDGRLRIDGWAFVRGVGADGPRSQRVTIKALRPGRLRPLWLRAGGVRARAKAVHRPELVATSGTELSDVSWAGFTATLDPRRLRSRRRWREQDRDLFVTVRPGRIWRARSRFDVDAGRPLRAVEHVMPGGAIVATAPAANGTVRLHVRTEWAMVQEVGFDGSALLLAGELRVPDASGLELELRRRGRVPLAVEGGTRFSARVPVPDRDGAWGLFLVRGGTRHRVTVAEDVEGAWARGEREVALVRALDGTATVAVRAPRATVEEARWTDDGVLELAGSVRVAGEELVLAGDAVRHAFPLEADEGRFAVRLPVAAVPSLGGPLPLPADTWRLLVRRGSEEVPVALSGALYDRLPLRTVVAHKPFRLGISADGDAILVVARDLDREESGRRNKRRLRATVYAAGRSEPLRDAVVYSSFFGRQYSDSPRAIHEELVRRDAPLEHLWVVRDGSCRVPPTASVLRHGSREYYEAFARSRFVVYNDVFPSWLDRRPDQVVLQTGHGTPLKEVGVDLARRRNELRRFEREWERQGSSWQYVLSPNRVSTPILRRSYPNEGELLETGLPKTDVLASQRDVRRALGLPEGARVVLYAPTYRDHVRDYSGRHRLEPALDVDRLRAAVGDDTIVLFRKHPRVVDPVPATADGFVHDVSSYPDATELLLAADVLVTDYSSLMFDFAVTGRPMVFFAYDLDAYRDEVRGFNFDYEAIVPGPLVRTNDELAEALRGGADFAERYRSFAATFCEFDDGRAAARVVDRLFGTLNIRRTEDANLQLDGGTGVV
ncbi:MAG TPA: CDP-glycerol glycerophosphotransferase family protein [Solirubrobacter sp.]|nr:CDP-glycerol glycerophosphotransferase family protein [Solirubrobacter sp.]